MDEVCINEDKPLENKKAYLNTMDCWLHFKGDCVNAWRCPNINQFSLIPDEKQTVKLRDIKRIHAREENRKQRELEKTKLFCETVEENVSHAESKIKKIQENTFLTNEELKKMINGNIEVLEKIEEHLTSLSLINSDLNIANKKLRDYNDVLENKVGKEKLFRNIFILMFIISFMTLIATNLRY